MKNQEARMLAHAMGEKTYIPDKPCKYGHVARRYVVNGSCVTCTNGLRLTAGVAQSLQPLQLLPVQIPRGLPPAVVDGINDYIHACMLSWIEQMQLMTPEISAAYAGLLKARQSARAVRDATAAPAAAPVKPAQQTDAEQFLAALGGLSGAQLDRATELVRHVGEPDGEFRARIKDRTLQNLGRQG